MGVLPDRSKSIVPNPYHDLMTNPDSPIIDFYPREFQLDMNGKKMEWEAVVKIPFIDEERLLAAMRKKDILLSDEEKRRNEFGVTIKFGFSPAVDFIYPSSFVGQFPDIPHCHCVESTFHIPTMEGLDIHIGLTSGVKLGRAALAGFPSLKTLPHAGNLGFHNVNIFQQDSRNESMVVTMLASEKRSKVEAAQALLGLKVYVGFPFLIEAKVVRVSDELFNYLLPETGGGPVISLPHGPLEISSWHRKVERIEGVYSKRLGMLIGQVESLVHVDILKGLKKTDEGATIKEYGCMPGLETDYASQMVVQEVESEDLRFVERSALPIQEEFPIGSRAFFLGESNYGRPLTVSGHTSEQANVWISSRIGLVSEFGRIIAMNADCLSPYTPSYAVAKMLNLNPLVLSKITSAFHVSLDDSRVNLGLNLKFEAKKLKVLGYSRREQNGWEFSENAINLLRQYMTRFPEFIAGIQRNPQRNTYEATDFYPKSIVEVKVKEIQTWLKSADSKNFEKVPLEAAQLDSDIVRKIEAAADEDICINSSRNIELHEVPRSALLKPSDAEHRLGHQRFALGDRVIYVQDSGRVPIASRGTVVGVIRTSRIPLLDVVFDVSFMSGTSLGDRCSPFRGSTVLVHSVLNITDRQLVTGSCANKILQTEAPTRPARPSEYSVKVGLGGQEELSSARHLGQAHSSFPRTMVGHRVHNRGSGAPRATSGNGNNAHQTHGLPIRGNANSFHGRGVQTNAFAERGRGSDGPQHFASSGYGRIDVSDPSEGTVRNNIANQPQLYAKVPPPPNLDWGRGRAREMARGGRVRGVGTRVRGAFRGRGWPDSVQQL